MALASAHAPRKRDTRLQRQTVTPSERGLALESCSTITRVIASVCTAIFQQFFCGQIAAADTATALDTRESSAALELSATLTTLAAARCARVWLERTVPREASRNTAGNASVEMKPRHAYRRQARR